jgi:hypothetical protein
MPARTKQLNVDPDDVREAVLRGVASIERSDSLELKDEAALKDFFEDIVIRGKLRLAAKKRAAGG